MFGHSSLREYVIVQYIVDVNDSVVDPDWIQIQEAKMSHKNSKKLI